MESKSCDHRGVPHMITVFGSIFLIISITATWWDATVAQSILFGSLAIS